MAAPPPPADSGGVQWHLRPPVPTNPVVFFDLTIGGAPVGRVQMELFADLVPKTAENFRQFCTGEFRCVSETGGGRSGGPRALLLSEPQRPRSFAHAPPLAPALPSISHSKNAQPVGYKGAPFHRVIKGFMLQGGDFLKADGTGCSSIYGARFPDEGFTATHTGPGLLSMANSGPDTNGCQFFITTAPAPWLDGKHVVFGRVVGDGLLTVRKVEAVPTGAENRPRLPVVVAECGEM